MKKNRLFKNISMKIVLLMSVILDIVLFILFGNGLNLFIEQGFIYAIKSFGYCTILNIFAIVGIEIILLNIIDVYLSKKRFAVGVDAICIGNNRVPFEREQNPTYLTSWEYEYNNKVYVIENSVSTNFDLPKRGSTRKIYIDPNTPEQDYYDPIFTRKTFIIYMILGLCSIFAYMGILEVGLMSSKSICF